MIPAISDRAAHLPEQLPGRHYRTLPYRQRIPNRPEKDRPPKNPKLNGGDMKSVQGDSGHAQLKKVADVYSHIIDDDRCLNAQRIEEAFYSRKKDPSGNNETADPKQAVSLGTVGEAADTNVDETSADAALLMKLLQKPQMAALLKTLAASL